MLGIVDWNEERYSKQGTGKRGNGRTTGAAVEQKWVDCHALSAIEETKTGIKSQVIQISSDSCTDDSTYSMIDYSISSLRISSDVEEEDV